MAFSDLLMHSLPAVGQIAGGPVGGAVGTLAAGVLGQFAADGQQKAADAAVNAIPMYDPKQLSYMNDVQRTERAFRAGTDPNTTNAIRQAVQAGGQVGANLVRAGGTDVFSNLLRGQAATQQAIGRYSAAAGAEANNVMNMRGRLVDNMAARVYSQQRMRADDLMAKVARTRQDANNNMLAAVPMLPQVGLKKSTTPFQDIFGQPDGALGGSWRSEGTNGAIPSSPTEAIQYPMIDGSVQSPTSGYDMGQQVIL